MRDWIDSYSADHCNPINQVFHGVCVPLIVWSVIALLWAVPVPFSVLRPGSWAVLAMVLAFYWYWPRSHRLALGLLIVFAALGLLTNFLYGRLGAVRLCYLATPVFVLAWVGQFIGHKVEGRKPSFLTDPSYLLVGPAWLMSKLFRKLGFKQVI